MSIRIIRVSHIFTCVNWSAPCLYLLLFSSTHKWVISKFKEWMRETKPFDEQKKIRTDLAWKSFFCNQDLDCILKSSFKVPDWKAKEVLSATLCLTEETRFSIQLQIFTLFLFTLSSLGRSPRIWVQCWGAYPCSQSRNTCIAVSLTQLTKC